MSKNITKTLQNRILRSCEDLSLSSSTPSGPKTSKKKNFSIGGHVLKGRFFESPNSSIETKKIKACINEKSPNFNDQKEILIPIQVIKHSETYENLKIKPKNLSQDEVQKTLFKLEGSLLVQEFDMKSIKSLQKAFEEIISIGGKFSRQLSNINTGFSHLINHCFKLNKELKKLRSCLKLSLNDSTLFKRDFKQPLQIPRKAKRRSSTNIYCQKLSVKEDSSTKSVLNQSSLENINNFSMSKKRESDLESIIELKTLNEKLTNEIFSSIEREKSYFFVFNQLKSKNLSIESLILPCTRLQILKRWKEFNTNGILRTLDHSIQFFIDKSIERLKNFTFRYSEIN